MSEGASQWLRKFQCTVRQTHSSDGREECKVLKVGHERPADTRSPDGSDRRLVYPVEGAGKFQWALRRNNFQFLLRLVSQFQGSGRDMSEDLLLKDECFSNWTRSCFEPIFLETRLCTRSVVK